MNLLRGPLNADQRRLAEKMIDAWTTFTRTGDPGWPRFPPRNRCGVAAHQTALGTVELALRDFHVLACATSRDTWRTIDGHIDMDWDGGPYRYEVVQDLIRFGEDPESGTIEPGELAAGVNRVGDLNTVWIYGVRVHFRPCSPIGAEASRKRAWSTLRTSTTQSARLSC